MPALPCTRLVLLLLAVGGSPSAAAQFQFAGEFTLPLFRSSASAADLNGDGVLDLVAAGADGRHAWMRGLGGGDFDAPVELGNTGDAGAVALAGDVDGDGHVDVVAVARPLAASVQVALIRGLGGGTFGPIEEQAEIGAPDPNRSVRASLLADLDGDGDIDLVHAVTRVGVVVQWNLGGTFSPGTPAYSDPRGAVSVDVADLDGDSDLDLLIGTSDVFGAAASVVALVHDGSGGFLPPATVAHVLADEVEVCAADLDGDGLDDALLSPCCNSNDQRAAVWHQNLGGALFGPAQVIDGTSASEELAVIDRDRDGDLDVLLLRRTSSGADRLELFTNDGTGAFGPAGLLATEVDASFPEGRLDVADLDADGFEDVLISGTLREPRWARNPGGTLPFVPLEPVTLQVSVLLADLDFADMDGDGLDDIVLYQFSEPRLLWFKNLGAGSYADLAVLTRRDSGLSSDPAFAPTSPRWLDLDGDGLTDILLRVRAGTGTSQLTVLPNLGGAVFGSPRPVVQFPSSSGDGLLFADVDRDGVNDLVVPGSLPLLFRGQGGGVFAPPQSLDLGPGLPWWRRGESPVAGDFNGDGILDIVFAIPPSNDGLRLLRGAPGGQFLPGIELALPGSNIGSPIQAADLDGDGDLDIAVRWAAGASIWWNDGAASPALPQPVVTIAGGGDLLVEDLNTDGDPDLIFGLSSRIGVSLNDGGALTQQSVLIDSRAESLIWLRSGDVDGDGVHDLLFNSVVTEFPGEYMMVGWARSTVGPSVGGRTCFEAVPNSSGRSGVLFATGSDDPASNNLTVRARDLPPSEFAALLASRTSMAAAPMSNTDGVLCLSGGIRRFTGPGEVVRTSALGTWSLPIDVGVFPALSGESWAFQLLHRDREGGPARANTTSVAVVTFQ